MGLISSGVREKCPDSSRPCSVTGSSETAPPFSNIIYDDYRVITVVLKQLAHQKMNQYAFQALTYKV